MKAYLRIKGIFCLGFLVFAIAFSCSLKNSSDKNTEYNKVLKKAKGSISTANFEKAIAILEEYKDIHGGNKEIDSLIESSKKLIPYRDSAQIANRNISDSLDRAERFAEYKKTIEKVTSSQLCINKTTWSSLYEIESDLEKLELVNRSNISNFTEKEQNAIQKCRNSRENIYKNMRKSFYRLFKDEAWFENIEVNLSGSNNEKLSLIGPDFYDDKEKLVGYELLKERLVRLGFKQVSFRGSFNDSGTAFNLD